MAETRKSFQFKLSDKWPRDDRIREWLDSIEGNASDTVKDVLYEHIMGGNGNQANGNQQSGPFPECDYENCKTPVSRPGAIFCYLHAPR